MLLAIILFSTALIAFSMISTPVFSASTLKCSTCHGSIYSQQLEFLEDSDQNSIPSIIQVGETLNVTVMLENIDDASKYFLLSDVSASLTSKNNNFSVNSSTCNIGVMAPGVSTVSWQITGTSTGPDELIISATGVNEHGNVLFTYQYSPNPSITVSEANSSKPAADSSPKPSSQPTASPTSTSDSSPIPTVPELSITIILVLLISIALIVFSIKAHKTNFAKQRTLRII
jgi:hypothetical protein